jgi:hypothetical protein
MISRAVPQIFNVRDPHISIDSYLREASPQIYELRPKEKTIMFQNHESLITTVGHFLKLIALHLPSGLSRVLFDESLISTVECSIDW